MMPSIFTRKKATAPPPTPPPTAVPAPAPVQAPPTVPTALKAPTVPITPAALAPAVVVVMDPDDFPPPRITQGSIRDLQVLESQQHHQYQQQQQQPTVRWVRCLVSAETGKAYCFVRTLREAIFGVVRHGVMLERDERTAVGGGRGEGGNGGFYRYRPDKQVAIKCMDKMKVLEQRGRIREDPMNELSALQLLQQGGGHANVQQLLECLEDDENLYSICPFYAGGELFSVIEQRGSGLGEERARVLFRQICAGLEYMHEKRLCHRDMSLENILVDSSSDGIIIDMGMCLRVPLPPVLPPCSSQQQPRHLMHKVLLKKQGQCGKITYMDPLVFKNQDFDGFSVDMWACGIILFILLAGVPPLELPSMTDPRFKMIAAGRLNVLLNTWQLALSEDARNLLGRLLNVNPEERASMEEVRGHRWMVG